MDLINTNKTRNVALSRENNALSIEKGHFGM